MNTITRTIIAAGIAAALTLGLAACGTGNGGGLHIIEHGEKGNLTDVRNYDVHYNKVITLDNVNVTQKDGDDTDTQEDVSGYIISGTITNRTGKDITLDWDGGETITPMANVYDQNGDYLTSAMTNAGTRYDAKTKTLTAPTGKTTYKNGDTIPWMYFDPDDHAGDAKDIKDYRRPTTTKMTGVSVKGQEPYLGDPAKYKDVNAKKYWKASKAYTVTDYDFIDGDEAKRSTGTVVTITNETGRSVEDPNVGNGSEMPNIVIEDAETGKTYSDRNATEITLGGSTTISVDDDAEGHAFRVIRTNFEDASSTDNN